MKAKGNKRVRWAIIGVQVGLVLLVALLVALGVNGMLSAQLASSTPAWRPAPSDEGAAAADSQRSQAANALIYNRNLFNQNAEPEPPPTESTASDQAAGDAAATDGDDPRVITGDPDRPAESELSLTLHGTMVSTDPQASVAHMRTAQNEDLYVRPGDDVPGTDATVVRVARTYVLLRRASQPDGPLEYISLNGKGPGAGVASASKRSRSLKISGVKAPNVRPTKTAVPATAMKKPAIVPAPSGMVSDLGGDEYAVNRQLAAHQNQRLDEVSDQLGLEPVDSGIRIGSVEKGSLFEGVGLADGDVITRVGNVDVQDPRTALSFLDSVSEGGEATIQIERGGRPRTVKIRAK